VVHGQDTISGEFEVRPEGELIVPVAGKFAAAGMTVDQLGTTVERKLQGVLANPLVTAAISLKRANAISVLGEVRTPGHLDVPNGEGVMDALARVGGLTEFADANAIFVIRRANNALRIRFRYDDLAGGDQKSLAFRLEDGDLIVVE
jgi:polysaccharide export outer membrane protein